MSDQPSGAGPACEQQPMDERQILAVIREVVERTLGRSVPIAPSMRLVEGLALDSVSQLTLIIGLEDRLRICFDESDDAAIQTVGDLVALIRRKRGGFSTDAR